MKKWFFFLFSCCTFFCSLSGAEFQLKERLEKARPGDFFVAEANKITTLVAIRSITPTTLLLEEITIPEKKKPASWPAWVKAKAPGHTSWSLIEIDLVEGQILECYSLSRSAWVQLSTKESLFATLMQLPLKPVDSEKRRRIGPAPLSDEPDRRKVWNPPIVIDGKKIENGACDAFETTWPEDGTELSGKTITLYFDSGKKHPFPFWIQIDTSHLAAALRTIDSGNNLPSQNGALPRRSPEFIGVAQKTETGLRLTLKSPKYNRQFDLFAVDITNGEKELAPLSFSLLSSASETVYLDIAEETLDSTLVPGHRYTWLLVPIGHTDSYIELKKPFTWNN
jgi:hypothetical protein